MRDGVKKIKLDNTNRHEKDYSHPIIILNSDSGVRTGGNCRI